VLADLHAHYAMHLAPEDQPSTLELLGPGARRLRRSDRLRATIVGVLGRFANYPKPDSLPRVTLSTLEAGHVRLVFSVLYSPFDEMDLGQPYAAAPLPEYAATLVRQLELVEVDVTERHQGTAVVAHDADELDRLLASGKIVFVHSVEGGFHLGSTTAEVERSVADLARRGVAYVTLAHLFFRRVATNAPAIPFIPDWIYRLVFPQPRQGLTELGKTAVEALVDQRILIDVAHMGERALADTFALLDRIDPQRTVPVLCTHAGCRFGRQEYNLSDDSIRAIASRDGVIGLIFANHQILDGLGRRKPRSLSDSVDVLARHIDRIRSLTGSHRHVGIGSDLDGFIKPTLPGLQTMADMAPLEAALTRRYGAEDARLICFENALRPLRSYWRSHP
jgi:microsomal dipeptidase-like Zn-dependent dipeptidase